MMMMNGAAVVPGTTVYTVLVVSMFIRCALLTYTWTWMSLVCFWLSFIFYFVFLLVYQVCPPDLSRLHARC